MLLPWIWNIALTKTESREFGQNPFQQEPIATLRIA